MLHIATHGYFLPPDGRPGEPAPVRSRSPLTANPMLRSGLALAGANTYLRVGSLPEEGAGPFGISSGLLLAEDVLGLDLRGTELVVLSACETGLGHVQTGEGVYGLQRAFAAAGARGVVTSLWKVPDEPTYRLMENFYDRLAEGVGPAAALAAAQAELREQHPDTYYWGRSSTRATRVG